MQSVRCKRIPVTILIITLLYFASSFLKISWSESSKEGYKVEPNFITGKFPHFERITLIIHMSEEYLFGSFIKHLEKLVARLSEWEREHIQVHIVIDKRNFRHKNRRKAEYPANFLRNLGRKYLKTRYFISSDLDILFSEGFENKMVATMMFNEDLKKTIFAYRLFEVEVPGSRLHRPLNANALHYLCSRGRAVQFHKRLYKSLPIIPGVDDWLSRGINSKTEGPQKIATFRLHSLHLEPAFAATNDIPLHDESFPYGLKDNTVLVRVQLFVHNSQ